MIGDLAMQAKRSAQRSFPCPTWRNPRLFRGAIKVGSEPNKLQVVVRLAMIGAAAAALSACASRPKPAPLASAPPRPPAPTYAAPPPARVGETVLPGSTRDFVVNVGDRVYFDFNAYEIRTDALPILEAQAAWLQRYPAVRVRIEGNCDERGTREYNLALGGRRAHAVREYLVAHGVSADRIATISYGKERPIDPGTGDAAWAHNRNAHTAIVSGAVGGA